MSKSAMVRARIEPQVKKEGETVLKQLGLSTSDFISMTFRQLIMKQGLPFDARIPNAMTIRAIDESRQDLLDGKLKRYTSSAELFDEMDPENDDPTGK